MRSAALSVVLGVAALAASVLPATAAIAAPGAWDPPVLVSDPDENVGGPQVVTDGATIITVWPSYDGTSVSIRASSSLDDGLTWSAPTTVSDSATNVSGVKLVAAGDAVVAVWSSEEVGGEQLIRSSASADGGLTWSDPLPISAPGDIAVWPQLVSDGTTVTATWTRGGRLQAASSDDGGLTWTAAVTISETGEYADSASIATDGTRLSVVWQSSVGRGSMKTSSSLDGGLTWTAPRLISGPDSFLPKLVTGGGVLTAAWYAYDGLEYHVLVASSPDGGATWSAPHQISGADGSAVEPVLATDGTTITALWMAQQASQLRIESASSTDGGVTWSPVVAVTQFLPLAYAQQVSDDGTTLTATWISSDGTATEVLTSSSADRGRSWTAPLSVSGRLASAGAPQIVDGGATTTIVWIQFSPAQSLDASSFTEIAAPAAPAGGTVAAALPPTGPGDVLPAAALALVLLVGGAGLRTGRSRDAG